MVLTDGCLDKRELLKLLRNNSIIQCESIHFNFILLNYLGGLVMKNKNEEDNKNGR